ncbi:S8 family serine peptidase [Streptomyces sp. 4N509B]|uniref:S8 family serine peptidase n=1 Tax=Streptomyces sp. 4N509B TaxID=3457413 RepID=UPI003FCEF062
MTTNATRRSHRALRSLLAAALLAGGVALAGAASPSAAASEPCRTRVVGEELPEGTGPHPLIEQLALRQAWDLSTGADVTVAVIDSGVDDRHPDLAENVGRGSEYTVVPYERGFDHATPERQRDCVGHGTAVAGLVAARRAEGDRMTGVAPDARVYPVRLVDDVARVTPDTLAAAIDDAVASGEADVINLSLAVPRDDDAVREAIAAAVAADVVVVAAAGNEGNRNVTGGLMYPAAYDGVLAVGAVDARGRPLDSSNAGPWVDLAAFGDDLVAPAPGGSGYRYASGTSAAAAQVAGAAALVRSLLPELTAEQVARRLTESATLLGGAVNERTGHGLVDPFGALTHLDEPAGSGDAGAGAEDGGEAEAEAGGVPGGAVEVQAIPREEPLLSRAATTAVAWSGGLLLAVVLGLLAAPGVRRAARRGWRRPPAAAPSANGPGGPGDTADTADTAGTRTEPPPSPGTRLAWLGGDGTGDPGGGHPTPHHDRSGSR